MVFIVLAILGILVYISVMYFKHIELKYKKSKNSIYDKTKTLEYVCPKCGRTIQPFNVLELGYNKCWYTCTSCGSAGDTKLSKLQKVKEVIVIDKIPNKDSFKDWDLKSAKDVEFTKVKETFNRKSDLD